MAKGVGGGHEEALEIWQQISRGAARQTPRAQAPQRFEDGAPPRSTGAGQDTKVTRLTRELDEALEQQAATSEILQVISSSAGDLQPVFATILEKAVRLCSATFGNIYRWEDGALHLLATHIAPALAEVRRRSPLRPDPQSFVARMVATKAAINIPDLAAEPFYFERNPSAVAAVELADMRSNSTCPDAEKK